MRYLWLFLLPFFLFAKPFKVATYNVENLFDARMQGSEYEEYAPKHNWTQRMVEIKLNHTAEVICDLDAEIIGLQEVENDNALKLLQQKLKEVGCAYPYRAISHKKGAPIQVALLSRFPIVHSRELEVSPSAFVRNILEADVNTNGHILKLLVNHWKSKSREGWESKRMAYAKVLKKRIEQLPKGTDYLLLGDFNTDYDAPYTLEKKLNDTAGKTGLHTVLGMTTDENSVVQNKARLYTLWQELPSNQRWSVKFFGKLGTPDHIVLPPSMFDCKGIDYVNDTFKVFRREYLFTKRGYINRWEYKKGRHMGSGYSDHLPVYAVFDTAPYKAVAAKTFTRQTQKIEYFYERESLDNDIVLNDAVVVWKRGRNALIKQTPQGRGIFIYGCAQRLEEGRAYDLLVRDIHTYHGLKEITQAYILENKGTVKADAFVWKLSDMRQNEFLRDITGTYRNKRLHVGNLSIPIYFKKGTKTPPEGARLKIDYGLLGYYKKLQLVVYSPDDFTILE